MEQEKEFEEMDTLSLVDEDGVEHEFEIADVLDVEDQEYMALIPLAGEDGEDDEDGELVILRVSQELDDSGEPYLEAILDEAEYDKVAQLFMGRLEEYYDFEDDQAEGGGEE